MSTEKKNHEWMFYLIENTVTEDTTDKIAKVKSKKTKGLEDIAKRIVQERTEYREETIVNILKMANKVKLDFFAEGERVNDEVVLFEPTITGNFYEDTSFVEGTHRCVLNARVTNQVHNLLAKIKGTYYGLTLENGGASIDGFVDTTTGAVNSTLTPGKTITITGNKIRIVPEAGEMVHNCIGYLNVETQEVIGQEDPPAINDPKTIVLQLPNLQQGRYAIVIKTLYSNAATTLKEPRYITSKLKFEVL